LIAEITDSYVFSVAQICNLPYRRIAFCGASASASALELSDALPITNRRYGRLQICATTPRCAFNTYFGIGLVAITGLFASLLAAAEEVASTPQSFDQTIRPLISEYCLKCHSTEKHKGDLDLERFSTLDEVKRHPKVWQTVAEQLANNEMPPKDKPQPAPAEREQLSQWVDATLNDMARARAGDPGPVVLRRLSNAEYTYTVRDLTGVETLDPAREFPADSAAGEGFMNVGNSLVMSPSLVTKYLDAGKEIASHAVLLPDGIRFSPKATRRDWTEEILAQIRGFYREFTDPRGGDKVNLQGIIFETNEGGRLPLELTDAERKELQALQDEMSCALRDVFAKHRRFVLR
jgi:hypothetical protein